MGLRPMPLPRFLLIPGTGTDMADMAMADTELMAMDTGLMAMEDTTTERGLLRPSPPLMPMPLLPLMLMPITDMAMAMAIELMAMVAITGLRAMEDTPTERGLRRPSPPLMPMLLLPLMLMPITDMAMAMATELMAMVAITGLMAMEDTTTERGLLRPSPPLMP